MKKLSFILLAGAVMLCGSSDAWAKAKKNAKDNKSIVVLFENDVHCGVDNYAKLAGLKNAINATDTAYCFVTSSGDYSQGGPAGTLSEGGQIIDIMNAVGYDAVTIGNHEFDYLAPRLFEFEKMLNTTITCNNFSDIKTGKQYFAPYVMHQAGNKKIAFVGTITPTTLDTESAAFYDKAGNLMFSLHPDNIFELVQDGVDKARKAGADYVVVLAHLGEDESVWTSVELIKRTNGIDAVLDGHTHSVIPDSVVYNKEGKPVHISQTGTKLNNIGKLLITKEGKVYPQLIPSKEITVEDSRVKAVLDSIAAENKKITDTVVGTSDYELTIDDANGNRTSRCGETNATNFTADAIKYATGAEISLYNGGGIRCNIAAGDITFGKILEMLPFSNDLCVKSVPGKVLIQVLQDGVKDMPGESGAFPQTAGLKFTIDLTSGKPIVKDVLVENKETGNYEPIDPERKYKLGTSTYLLTQYDRVLESCETVSAPAMCDNQAARKYFVEALHGHIGEQYKTAAGRIKIVK